MEAYALMTLVARQSAPGNYRDDLSRLADQLKPEEVARGVKRADELQKLWKNGRPWADDRADFYFLSL